MTFDPNIPNAAQSPGLFPPQNATNFTRLKTIINVDHVFNDTAQSTDGVHKQMTMIARALATPADLPTGTQSLAYSWIDSLGRTQLRFYNGITDAQLTPPEELYPIRIVGSASLNPNQTAVAYANPGFRWAGTGWSIAQGTNIFRYYNLLRSGANDLHEIDNNSNGISRPTLEFSGNDVLIRNQDSSTRVCVWSLIINRIV